jgi:YidC/Oxa1 family membrane protein insertase
LGISFFEAFMKFRTYVIGALICFVGVCGFMVCDTGLFGDGSGGCGVICLAAEDGDDEAAKPADVVGKELGDKPKVNDSGFLRDTAVFAAAGTKSLGSIDPDSEYMFEIDFTSVGAAISKVTMSGFDERDSEDKLVLLSPMRVDASNYKYSMANGYFKLDSNAAVTLDKLDWAIGDVEKKPNGEQTVSFSTTIYKRYGSEADLPADRDYRDAIKLVKTYSIVPDSYDVGCELSVENVWNESIDINFAMQGPCGINREGVRQDMRSVVVAYMEANGELISVKRDNRKLRKNTKKDNVEELLLKNEDGVGGFVWASTTNKYFSAIVRPVPAGDDIWAEATGFGRAQYFDPDDPYLKGKDINGDEGVSFNLINSDKVGAGDVKSFAYEISLVPNDKTVFENDETYSRLGFMHVIGFMPCPCLPDALLNFMSFGIMWIMKMMYAGVHNYGVVIILFVLLVRLMLHPVTKKSQVSMMAMQKLGPKMEALKVKYGNDKTELQKQTMGLYREMGVSPVASFLPMMLQMPIWIALYRAIYANFELRGAGFLPWWITDLSAPDALIPFTKVLVVPLVGWHIESFNLLPILLALAMFLQQKLMPHSANKSNPQAAQQQKMMMFMMPIMMLVFLYKAPAALNLYISASTFGGIWEQKIIRKHIKKKEAEESQNLVSTTRKIKGHKKKKKPKPFFKDRG